MRLSRLRSGEALALAGAIALLVLLCLNWFDLRSGVADLRANRSGIGGLGWFPVLLCLIAIALAFATAFMTATQRSPALPIGLTVLTVAFSIIALVVLVVRTVLLQPGLGVEAGNDRVDLLWPAYFGLLAALALAVGAWRAMGDERTDASEAREQTEDVLRVRGAPRPAPPRAAPAATSPPTPRDALADPPS